MTPELSRDEILRYSRHLVLPEVTLEGQRKLKCARVLCVGAGGLGSPLTLYLAAAGVGTIGLVDFDAVDLTNLQRQILYATDDVGRPKLEAARERLAALNPDDRDRPAPGAADERQRDGGDSRLRRRRRRHRQLSDPLPGQRRLRASPASRTSTAASSASRARSASSTRRADPATAASSRSRRRPGWYRPAPKAACSACCRASSARCRRSRSSS